MNDPQQNARDSATHYPASGTRPPARTSVSASPPAVPQEGTLEGRAGGDPGSAQAAGRRLTRRKRNDSPDQVLDRPSAASPAALDPSAGEVLHLRGLEAMVGDLLDKLRLADLKLKEKDSALKRLKQETASRDEELENARRNRADRLSLAALDFSGAPSGSRPARTRPAKKVTRTRDLRIVPPAGQAERIAALRAAGRCPGCGHDLRKAKCVNVIAQVCLRCRGIFIDHRSIRQMARTQNWFRSVERFLSGPARVTAAAAKTGRLSRTPGR